MKPIFRSLVFKGIEHCDPTQVKIELTAACNLRCEHCYQEHGAAPALQLDELRPLFDKLVQANTLLLVFTGGEPFCHRDFLEIVREARSRGFLVELLSNATLIDAPSAQALRREGVQKVQVSLYGPSASVHDAITHIPGSFERTRRGISHLRSAGIPVTVACSLLRQNYKHWRAIRALVEGELGLELGMSFRLYESQENSERLRESGLDLEEIRAYLREIYSDRLPRSPKPATEEDLDQLVCLAGINNCRILPNGDVLACAQLGQRMGNIHETDFLTIWRTSPVGARLRALRRRDLQKCSTCANFSICLVCPGYFEDLGDDFVPPARFCAIAAVDAEERALAVKTHGGEALPAFPGGEKCDSV